ncbi:MAG: hypothetical protein GWN18_18970 [Thermoplasmata archaeon]|nr:hypothetical protein [Thermoplasmata archaeon]NIS14219.1 hypothetical protein [Thermoplasmata archaeon]NIS22054.1 hypothetical protein [Thermoplasmata archaeon]NIT79925.1 hypothetical protein [Thermoplasmata archaeon]NIU51075.1 hypothetical protein [Thermoplasmata archaeon]
MDTASVEAALVVEDATVASKTWRLDDTVLALAIDMTDGQRITVTVGTEATDKAGNHLPEEFSFYFVTKEFEEQTDETPGMAASLLLVALFVAALLATVGRRR